jgi:hypothetical protein
MGASPSKKETKLTQTDIQNELNTMITNSTENINNIVNQTTTEVTTKLVNKNISTAKANIAAGNTLKIKNIRIGGENNKVNFEQNLKVKASFEACQELLNSTAQMSKLASEVNNNIQNKLQNDNAAQDSIKTLALCQAAEEKQGGITGMLGKVVDILPSMIDSFTGKETKSETITKISTKIGVNLSNYTKNENNISNSINNKINTAIENINETSCNFESSIQNAIEVGDIDITGKNNEFAAKQDVSIDTVVKCIQNSINKTELIQDLTQKAGATATTDTSNKNVATKTVANDATTKSSTTLKSDLGGIFGGFGGIGLGMATPFLAPCICCCCCILIIIFAMIILPKLLKGKNNTATEGTSEVTSEGTSEV